MISRDGEKGVSTYHASKDSSRTHTADGSSHDQSSRGGSRSTQGGRRFEDQDTPQEGPFDREQCIELSKDQLQRAAGQQICAPVPADACERMEFVCNSGDGLDVVSRGL
jgi:hypothetical protein